MLLRWLQTNSNNKGFTLTELIVVLGLISFIIAGAYNYFFLSHGVWNRVEAETTVVQEARITLLHLEKDIRGAQRGPGGENAVRIFAEGMQLDIYTDVTGDENLDVVRYELYEDSLRRGVAVPAKTLSFSWQEEISNLANDREETSIPIFSLDGKKVKVQFKITADNNRKMMQPLSINGTFTIRSKDVM